MFFRHLILPDPAWFYGWEPLMVSDHPAKFGSHKHCGTGDMMFLVVEEQDWKYAKNHTNNSDPGHTHLKYQLEKSLKKLSPVRPKKVTIGKKRRNRNAKRFALHTNVKSIVRQYLQYLHIFFCLHMILLFFHNSILIFSHSLITFLNAEKLREIFVSNISFTQSCAK